MSKRSDLDRLTRRWRERHDARRSGDDLRPRANPGREALARRGFPYHDVTPAKYVAEHSGAMVGFTYDEESYADADLDAWIVEVGRLLREQREGPAKPAEAAEAPAKASAKKPAAKKPAAKKPAAKKPAADG
ncbi:MAG TPA: hypothetical protein VES36_07550 [Candidatus Limnocylindrales bacterium]|nr:hypothetical protein [Candidatus Limnocylindrales bacterium]